MSWFAGLALVIFFSGLSYARAPLLAWIVTSVVLTVGFSFSTGIEWPVTLVSGLLTMILVLLGFISLRRKLISKPIFAWFRTVLPNLSDTEQQALDAGTVWWDAELFSGKPEWGELLKAPKPHLSDEEQAFLDGPVDELVAMLDNWEVDQDMDLPPEAWKFMADMGFFGMIIPKKYDGLEFSAQANSAVVMKLSSGNLTAAITVMVPNSLGPAELLLHYGTDEQKQHYLPRLARGIDIPCFALTSPSAGSDAGAIPDVGIVCKGQWNGERVLGLKLTWNKRYITLAPVATVLGLAFRVMDPDHLLSETEDRGISCALIPTDLPGVETGERHLPSGTSFMNGPTRGEGVFIPIDFIIGGEEQIGQGWSMLVQSLAAGRAISLPALSVAGGKMSALMTGAYARIRKQFSTPIAYFEGVEEPLTRIAGNTYRMDAARKLTLVALDMGERPSVLTAIVKYYLTEANRDALNDAMDVHAGKGIIQGPNNYLNAFYQAIPIGITVEGANILTRTMIVFGQGAIRAHPYLLKEMQAAKEPDQEKATRDFDRALFAHIGFTISNIIRAFTMGITGARLVRSPVQSPTAHFYRQLTRMSTAFAMTADLTLLVLGGAFKFREKISGRLADVLGHLYMASAVLKNFEDDGRPTEDLPLVNWAMRDSLFLIQNRLINVLRNFPIRWMGKVIKFIIFPIGHPYTEPSDNLGKRAARLLISDNPARDRLTQGIYRSCGEDAAGLVSCAFSAVLAATAIEKRIRAHYKIAVSIDNYEELVGQALDDDIINVDEAELVRNAQHLSRKVIDVDAFSREQVERKYKVKSSTP